MSYSRFASHFYRQGLASGFQLMGADASSPSEASYFHLQKVERATTFLYITVCDTARADWQALLEKDAERRAQAEHLLKQVQSVALVYLLVEPTAGIDLAAVPAGLIQPYEGEPLYSVFWRVSLENGEITVPPGQPAELFGLNTLVKKACEAAAAPEPDFDALSSAESLLGGKNPAVSRPNVVPLLKTLPKTKTRTPGLLTRIRFLNINLYPKYHHPIVAYTILAVNLIVLLAMTLRGDPNSAQTGYRFGGIFFPSVLYGGEWWRLFTAMFVHFGFMHFIANTFGIIVFGTRIERYFGRIAFLALYFISGLTGSVFSLLNLRLSNSFAVSAGASGAVYGLVAAVFVFTRLTRREIETLNWYTMMIFIGIGLVMGFALPGIDNAGHIGGMVGGALAALGMLTVMAYRK
jgi:membrane associated rhomboid family serine protease